MSEMHPYYSHVWKKCLIRDRERRYHEAGSVKKAVIKEKARKTWIAMLWGILITMVTAGTILICHTDEIPLEAEQFKATSVADTVETQPVAQDLSAQDSINVSAPKENKKPAAKSIDTPPAENLDADALEALFNDAAQSIL